MSQSNNPSTLLSFRKTFSGIRANRYSLDCPFPTNAGFDLAEKVYVRAISFPGSNIGMIPVAYQGRVVKYSGERQFGEWTMQVYDSSDRDLRKRLEDWMQTCDNASSHAYNSDVSRDWVVNYGDDTHTNFGTTHPGHIGPGTRRSLKLRSCWPTDISPIDLSHDSYDTFAEFSLTIAYDYHEYVDSGGNANIQGFGGAGSASGVS